MRHPTLHLRTTGIAVTVLLCAAVVPAVAQQAADSSLVVRTNAAERDATTSSPAPRGPRIVPSRFQSAESVPARGDANAESADLPASNPAITISTLTLVLVAIIVVLLVT